MYEFIKNDFEALNILNLEIGREQNNLELIASENFVSPADRKSVV